MGRFSEVLSAAVNTETIKPIRDLKSINEQIQKDLEKQRMLSDCQRRYMKCSNGKCVPILNEQAKQMRRYMLRHRKINVLSKKKHDDKLSRIFVEKGREKRIKALEKEVYELDLRLNAANGKLYLKENEENFRKIAENLETQKTLIVEIERAKMEISHLKSQFERLDKRAEDLKKETESEMKFAEHLKKANRQLEIYEGRVEASRQRECLATVENQKLRNLFRNMLHDRAYFNKYWATMVKKLKDRKKFLLDMIEKSSQGFSQDADFMDNLKQLSNRRAQDLDAAIADILKMKRQIDANQIMSEFLGGKGKQRFWKPLEMRELKRRDVFKREYNEKINFYSKILKEIKKFTKDTESLNRLEEVTNKSILFLTTLDNDGFQLYNYLNELSSSIETSKIRLNKDTFTLNVDLEKRNQTKKFFESRIEEHQKILDSEIEKTLRMRDQVETYDTNIKSHFTALREIVDLLDCDLTSINSMLGNNDKVIASNLHLYLRLLETRLNDMLAFIYCDERDGMDLLLVSDGMVVESLKRDGDEPPVKLDEVIITSECPECGELEDVNRFDDKIVHCLDEEGLQTAVAKKYEMPETETRLHNLLSCNLPRSGVIASRRYAE